MPNENERNQVRQLLRDKFPRTLGARELRAEDPVDLEHSLRAVLLSLLKSWRPDADADLLNNIHTWGDVFDWFPAADGHDRATPFKADESGRVGARVEMRPVSSSDLPLLYEAATGPVDGFRWRFRGRTPSFQEFEQTLFDGVLAQFIVTEASVPIGLVVAYNADMPGGSCSFGFFRVHRSERSTHGSMIEGAAMFLNYCFDNWPFRKIYFELPDYSLYLVRDLVTNGIAREEGRLHEYIFHDGQYCDLVYVSVSREVWKERVGQWFSP